MKKHTLTEKMFDNGWFLIVSFNCVEQLLNNKAKIISKNKFNYVCYLAINLLYKFEVIYWIPGIVVEFGRGSRNWLLHARYVRGEHAQCIDLADDLQRQTNNTHRYAHFIKVLNIIQNVSKILQKTIKIIQERFKRQLWRYSFGTAAL